MPNLDTVHFFVNGTGMRGGDLHAGLGDAKFIYEAKTAPNYKFLTYNRKFPGLLWIPQGGASISGEVYSVNIQQLFETFLPSEPEELELSVISLEDNSYVLGMVVRRGLESLEAWEDISRFGGWRAFQSSMSKSK